MVSTRRPDKKIFLLFPGRFPSEKAASLFAAKNCESFANLGAKVTLVVPRRLKRSKENVAKYYNIDSNFEIKYVTTLDLFNFLKKIAFYINLLIFSLTSLIFLLRNAKKTDLIYTNETLPLLFASFFFENTLLEVHDYPENKKWFYGLLFSRTKWMLITNKWKLKKIVDDFKLPRNKIFLERNAVETKDFDIKETKQEARDKLDFPFEGNKKIILYTGHLYDWKGVDTLAEATRELPGNYEVIFVGGTKDDIDIFRDKYGDLKNIRIVGFRPHKEIPLWQRAADLLVLPNTAKQNISKYYTSPMKLFEYMASLTPTLASNILSITEIVNENNAFIVKPDNPQALGKKIIEAVTSEELATKKAKQARIDIEEHTWEKRAERIFKNIDFN